MMMMTQDYSIHWTYYSSPSLQCHMTDKAMKTGWNGTVHVHQTKIDEKITVYLMGTVYHYINCAS